jgi:hypothetical protein
MRKVFWLVAALCTLVLRDSAQAPLTNVPVYAVPVEVPVYLATRVRLQLIHDWDGVHPQQPERGYCLVTAVREFRGDSVYVVTGAYRAVPDADDPYWVRFGCGPNQAFLHVHTPTTCGHDSDGSTQYQTCVLGGPDAFGCLPSPVDQQLANHRRLRFLLIQCDRDAVIAFYPEVAADGTAVDSTSHK